MEFLRAFLKNAASRSRQVLTALFNYSLRIGRLPSDWKSGDVTPVHKNDLLEPIENYRPISLLPTVSKVMERCVCNRLFSLVSQSITSLQHGFMRSRSWFFVTFVRTPFKLGRHLTKTNRRIFCTLILPRLSTQLITSFLLKS